MSGARAIVRLEGVEKHYGRATVLRVEDLALFPGELVQIQGPNGAGKTTLLKLIAGISKPDRGRVHLSDGIRSSASAYVPQVGGLYRELRLRENLRLYSRLYGYKETDLTRARHVRALGLVPFLNMRFSELSGGYQRLAVLAAAMLVSPDWLLVDEPFSGLDTGFVDLVREQLMVFRSRARLLVLTSHQGKLMLDADRVIEVDGGRVS